MFKARRVLMLPVGGAMLALFPSISALLVQEGDGKTDDVTVPGMGCEVETCCSHVQSDKFYDIFRATEGGGTATTTSTSADYSPSCTILNLFPKIKDECLAKEVILDCEVCGDDETRPRCVPGTKACGDTCVGVNRTCFEEEPGTACDEQCSALGKAGVPTKGLTLQGALTGNELAVHVLAAGLPLVGTFVEPGTCQDLDSSTKCWKQASEAPSWTNWKIVEISSDKEVAISTSTDLMWHVGCSRESMGLELWAKWVDGDNPFTVSEGKDAKDYGGGLEPTFLAADAWNKDPHWPHDGQPRWQCKDIPKRTESKEGAAAPLDYRMLLYSVGSAPCPASAVPPTTTTGAATTTTAEQSAGGGGGGGGNGAIIAWLLVFLVVVSLGTAYYFNPDILNQFTQRFRPQAREQEMASVS